MAVTFRSLERTLYLLSYRGRFFLVKDLPLYTRNVLTDLYADDTPLYYIHTSQNTIEQNLQVALNQLHIWCKNNGMVLQSAKTEVSFINI